ncbi:MAG TPA: hypothetical protein VF221_00015, partial [Chloroflexota bacterium]
LHFLAIAKNGETSTCSACVGSTFKLAGGGSENWWGVLHTFPQYEPLPVTSNFDPPTVACTLCSVTINGSTGGANGPPMLIGQVIANDVTFGGNPLVEVFDRPGGAPRGPGTGLVQ